MASTGEAVRSAARTYRGQRDLASHVGLLITSAAVAASILLVSTAGAAVDAARHEPRTLAVFGVLALVLQLFSFEVYGRGSMSVSAVGFLAAAFALPVGAAVWIAVAAAVAQWIRRRGALHKAIFDAANFALSMGAAASLYSLLDPGHAYTQLLVGTVAGIVYSTVNHGMLCLAMSLSEGAAFREVWHERFHWARHHFLAFGPLAVALSIAYVKLGVIGLLAFALPPAVLVISVRQYLERTRVAVEELRVANTALAVRNEDLDRLFRFAGGLSAHANDTDALVRYAEDSLGALIGAEITLGVGAAEGSIPLVASGAPVGALELHPGRDFDEERWERLRDAILPQLATAVESAVLVEQVRKTHLATIAALSRSMEAKDGYTGGHTERVSGVAVALARRLGYSGADLDAVEIGAVLHDIGKIGIPERILHKPGPLDDEEWRVMKKHPKISEYILSGVDLPKIVLDIARSSHERMDGAGYPDGLAGESIPLPARIVLVADALDALTSDRPYRRARSLHAAMEEIQSHTGTQFCPRVVAALQQVYREEPYVLAGRLLAVEENAA
jgi:putative nucleotidyltransferase with HDIG domain